MPGLALPTGPATLQPFSAAIWTWAVIELLHARLSGYLHNAEYLDAKKDYNAPRTIARLVEVPQELAQLRQLCWAEDN